MPATIDVDGIRATIRNGAWSSSEPGFALLCDLSARLPPWDTEYQPDPDYGAAYRACVNLGGKIVDYERPAPGPEGVIY